LIIGARRAQAMSEEQDKDWHFAGLTADFEDEDIEQVKVGPLAIAVYRAKGNFYATQDLCTHEHAYLSDGILIDCVVECPFHQGRFDVRTGAALSAPVIVALKTYPLKIVDGKIYVNVSVADAETDSQAQSTYWLS
jgi:3-phenylpropionate/trans-cinnamate dioxygenase ferredoxin subunit